MIRRLLLATIALALPLGALATPFWGAKESRPPETTPEELKPGEFVWNPAAAEDGPILVLVSLDEQRAYVYRNGIQIGLTTISSGKSGHETPTGTFVILQKDKDHRSSKYNSAPMPYTQRLTWDGVALHAGGLPGYPSSHGCVHLPSKFSEELFAVSPMGMTVVVANDHSAPARVAHPPAFAPIEVGTGAPVQAAPLQNGEEYRLEPEKSEHGPVSILMSVADRRVIVLRNGIEIGRAKISLTDTSVPIGTHTFILQEGQASASLGVVPDPRSLPWLGVQTQGHADDAGRAMRPEAVAAISIPAPFMRALSLMISPGTTFFVTEAPILAANLHTGFTVLSNGAPDSEAN
jgi:hypothetical protein